MIPYLHTKNGRVDWAIRIYQDQLNAVKTDFEQQLIQDQLKVAYMRKHTISLEEAIIKYQKKTGNDPDYFLENLVKEGILTVLPPEPHGGYYFWDESKEEPNSNLHNYRIKKAARTGLETSLQNAYKNGHEYPPSLEEALDLGLISSFPEDPFGGGWGYNPATGSVADVTLSRKYAPSGLIPN